MSIHPSAHLFFGCRETHFATSSSRVSATLDIGVTTSSSPCFEETKHRIADLIHNPQLSVSTYDTAWVAMVPSPHSSHHPRFPNSLKWLLENQCHNGSWARPHHHSLLQKDVLSSTLACVLALKKWGMGEDHIHRGLGFIESSFAKAMDESQISPTGFDVVFPSMVEYARGMDLNLNLEKSTFDNLIYKRELELSRCYKNQSMNPEAYLAYICEGMGEMQNWETVKKYQRRNGSLFNSPSATAAAFIGLPDAGFLNYLQSALNKFGDAVPAMYPMDIYLKLCVVDNLEKLGIAQHFTEEIKSVLDETYRFWVQGNEEIFLDASCCAFAFRLLRKNGYDVASDQITKILQEYHSSLFSGNTQDLCVSLELYRASEFVINCDESELEKQNLRLKHLLEEELSGGFIYSNQLVRNIELEVNHALEYPFFATLDRIENHRNIKHYNPSNIRMLKTATCFPSFGNMDLFSLSAHDFNKCQTIHREELKELERWVADNRLDELKFARNKSAYCYFSAAATIFDPSLSDARMSWAKNGILTTVVDDFFDCEGCIEELRQLIQLVEIWDAEAISVEFDSPNVEIIFLALKRTICEIGEKGSIRQGRPVTNHVVEIWLDLLKSMMKEAEWAKDNTIPTMDEYMSNAYVSFALGPIVLPVLYLVGPKLTEEMVRHPQYNNLFKLMSTCGRLLNDIRTCEREIKEGKLNALPLYMNNTGGEITKQTAIMDLKRTIMTHRRELLRLVLDGKGCVIPKACKELFWHMCTVVHLFYHKDDGFTSKHLIKVVNAIIHEPIVVTEF